MKLVTLLLLCFSSYGFNAGVNDVVVDPPKFKIKKGIGKKAEMKYRAQIATFAKGFKGKKYSYGGNGPTKFDCSGLSNYIFHHYGIVLKRSSSEQARQGKYKRLNQLKPADLVFFGTGKRVQHVGIIVEASKDRLLMVHSSSSKGVVVEDIMRSTYWKERLLFGKDVLNI